METIYFKRVTFQGRHGCTSREKFRAQTIVTDVSWKADVLGSIITDLPADTVDWMPIQELVREVVTGRSRNTVETIAGRIAILVLHQDERTQSVTVSVSKPEEREDRNGVPGTTITLTREDWVTIWLPKGLTAEWARST